VTGKPLHELENVLLSAPEFSTSDDLDDIYIHIFLSPHDPDAFLETRDRFCVGGKTMSASAAQSIENYWKQSLCGRFLKALLESLLKSRTYHFITGPSLSEQCSHFQDTLTYRSLAALSRLFAPLRRISLKAAQGSISRLISNSFVCSHSYLIFFLIAAYPLVDYLLRNAPGTSMLGGIWDELVFLVTALLLLCRFFADEEKKFSFTPLDLPILLFVGTGIFLYLVKSPAGGPPTSMFSGSSSQ
jgi:hypothetical protein